MSHIGKDLQRIDVMLDDLALADPFAALRDYLRPDEGSRLFSAERRIGRDVVDDVEFAFAAWDSLVEHDPHTAAIGPIDQIVDGQAPDDTYEVQWREAERAWAYLAKTSYEDPAFAILTDVSGPVVLKPRQAIQTLSALIRWGSTVTVQMSQEEAADLLVACRLLEWACARNGAADTIEARHAEHSKLEEATLAAREARLVRT